MSVNPRIDNQSLGQPGSEWLGSVGIDISKFETETLFTWNSIAWGSKGIGHVVNFSLLNSIKGSLFQPQAPFGQPLEGARTKHPEGFELPPLTCSKAYKDFVNSGGTLFERDGWFPFPGFKH